MFEVRGLQFRLAGGQLSVDMEIPRSIEVPGVHHTFTPTAQNKETMPNPARQLAMIATPLSLNGRISRGRLQERSFGCG